jgi:hypothetical protein
VCEHRLLPIAASRGIGRHGRDPCHRLPREWSRSWLGGRAQASRLLSNRAPLALRAGFRDATRALRLKSRFRRSFFGSRTSGSHRNDRLRGARSFPPDKASPKATLQSECSCGITKAGSTHENGVLGSTADALPERDLQASIDSTPPRDGDTDHDRGDRSRGTLLPEGAGVRTPYHRAGCDADAAEAPAASSVSRPRTNVAPVATRRPHDSVR